MDLTHSLPGTKSEELVLAAGGGDRDRDRGAVVMNLAWTDDSCDAV